VELLKSIETEQYIFEQTLGKWQKLGNFLKSLGSKSKQKHNLTESLLYSESINKQEVHSYECLH
jgi:hypothetical protein